MGSGNLRRSITYFVGPSSGANYAGSIKSSEKYGTTVTVFPDDFSKYIDIYREIKLIK